MSVAKKKKHVSKKNKKAWRKHCDIKDVEDFLEDQRLEERLGKFDVKPDSELFLVDTAGETKTEEELQRPLSAKLRKRARLGDTPKCFEVLLPTSKVPDPNAKRNHVNPIGFKSTALSKLTEKRQIAKGAMLKKLDQAGKNRKIALEKKRKMKNTRQNFNVDIWGGDLSESKGIPQSLCDEFITPEAQLHNVLPDKRLRPKPPIANSVKTRAAIDTPHPGISYNPTYQEHQELLQNVVQHEQNMMKREAHLHRVTTGMFSRVTAEQKENQWREEMSSGLALPHKPGEESSESDNEYKSINPPVKNKKKDHKARRKQREMIAEKERIKRLKIDKKKISDIYRLRKLTASVYKTEQLQSERQSKRVAKRVALAATATPVLNAHKTPIKEPDFVEPAQLSGDLRHVTSNTNLLRDRYESLQRRGALAGARVMMKKKKKVKRYFKPGHKVTDKDIEKYVARNEKGKK